MTNGVLTIVHIILLSRRMCITMNHLIVDNIKGGNYLHLHLCHPLHPILTLLPRHLLLQRDLLKEAIDICTRLGNGPKQCKCSKKEPKVLLF